VSDEKYKLQKMNSTIQGGSIGTSGTPIFDAGKLPSSILPNDALHDLLIRNEPLGDALAKSFSKDSDVRKQLIAGLDI
jgi:hypothetical protein